MIKYKITPKPNFHLYNVLLEFTPNTNCAILKLPTWVPGSYMIREFSKNIISIHATQNHKLINCNQINKNTWQIEGCIPTELIQVEYTVYALDFGIRTAYLDHSRGYFNSSSLCLYVEGTTDNIHTIEFTNLPKTWGVATGLNCQDSQYIASNYYELIDCPFELGEFIKIPFLVKGVPHYFVLSGIIPANFDSQRLITDVSRICEAQINLFGGVAPFYHYTFMLYLGGEIYTGLEHSNSTALMAPYYSLPGKCGIEINDDYLKLLGLISHEYFHLWNVKRIKPQVFNPYNLENENYTQLLWWFEGITSYYDDLILYRAGLINQERYLQLVLDNINNVYKYNGVNQQSLINSSLTAWIKYYRQDENSPNSLVSYYVKGALVGLCIDLLLRKHGTNKYLDDALLGLYNKWKNDDLGIGEDELPKLIKEYTQIDLSEQIALFTETTNTLPLIELLKDFGLSLVFRDSSYTANGIVSTTDDKSSNETRIDLGIKVNKDAIGYRVLNVYNDSIAQQSGLAANDILLAIDEIKLSNLDKQLSKYKVGDSLNLTLFRQERLFCIKVNINTNLTQVGDLKITDYNKLSNWL